MNRIFFVLFIAGSTHLLGSATLSLRQNIGKGVGYDSGYTTLSGTVVPFTINKSISFVDIRAHHFNRGGYAANAGVGFRIPLETICTLLGVNVNYDYRESRHRSFHQIGLGFEMLRSSWGLFLNGYLPIAKTEQAVCRCHFNNYVGGFFIHKKKIAKSLRGIDLQAEAKIFKAKEFSFHLLGGPYYYSGICKNFVGIRGALSGQWKRLLRLTWSMTYDPVFKARTQGEIAFIFSWGGRAKKENNCLISNSIFMQPVQRNEIIALDHFCRWKWNF